MNSLEFSKPLNVPVLRSLLSLFVGIWGVLKPKGSKHHHSPYLEPKVRI